MKTTVAPMSVNAFVTCVCDVGVGCTRPPATRSRRWVASLGPRSLLFSPHQPTSKRPGSGAADDCRASHECEGRVPWRTRSARRPRLGRRSGASCWCYTTSQWHQSPKAKYIFCVYTKLGIKKCVIKYR